MLADDDSLDRISSNEGVFNPFFSPTPLFNHSSVFYKAFYADFKVSHFQKLTTSLLKNETIY